MLKFPAHKKKDFKENDAATKCNLEDEYNPVQKLLLTTVYVLAGAQTLLRTNFVFTS
jgi:hypothetical protein